MPLDLATVRRFSRHLALPEIGVAGQERFAAATVALVGDGLVVETAGRYLTAAGAGALRTVNRPADGAGWVESLRGASVIVRAGFEDDPMLRAAVRLGIPAVVVRARGAEIDLVSFRRHGPCPHASLDVAAGPPETQDASGAAGVLAGTLAAAEALWILAEPEQPPRARHLRLSMATEEPVTQEIPWAPECFVCGGQGREAVLS